MNLTRVQSSSTIKNEGFAYFEKLERADAHPYGSRPFKRENYIKKFNILTNNVISKEESQRFLKEDQNLEKLKNGQLSKLNISVNKKYLKRNIKKGIF